MWHRAAQTKGNGREPRRRPPAAAAAEPAPIMGEVVTTNLQTRTRHADQAYELSPAPLLPMNAFYQRHVSESPLQHPDSPRSSR